MCCEGELFTLFQRNGVLKLPGADFRAFCVQHQRNRKVQFCTQLLYCVRVSFLLCMRPVGKIQTRHIHTAQHDLPENVLAFRCRAQCADDFGFSHIYQPRFRYSFWVTMLA
jgi:hypothetical protein